jgi:hypothetical protein
MRRGVRDQRAVQRDDIDEPRVHRVCGGHREAERDTLRRDGPGRRDPDVHSLRDGQVQDGSEREQLCSVHQQAGSEQHVQRLGSDSGTKHQRLPLVRVLSDTLESTGKLLTHVLQGLQRGVLQERDELSGVPNREVLGRGRDGVCFMHAEAKRQHVLHRARGRPAEHERRLPLVRVLSDTLESTRKLLTHTPQGLQRGLRQERAVIWVRDMWDGLLPRRGKEQGERGPGHQQLLSMLHVPGTGIQEQCLCNHTKHCVYVMFNKLRKGVLPRHSMHSHGQQALCPVPDQVSSR